MKLCPKCKVNFIKEKAKTCRVCYLKTQKKNLPICKCGKELSNYNNKICKKCFGKSRGRKIEQLTKKGIHLAFWESINSASRLLNLRQSDLVNCLQKKRPSVGGFYWKYV